MKPLFAILLLLGCTMLQAQVQVNQEPLVFDSLEQQQRFNEMTEELRCLVCQNQNLADSDAPLAHDLRDEIYKMMKAGHSNDQIKQFLIERYGDFVLYRPPVQGNTLVLWLGPALLLLGGLAVVIFSVRKRAQLIPAGETEKPGGDKS